MKRQELEFSVNGAPVQTWAAPDQRLVDLLRDTLGLTGTKEGCGEGECGACTVLVDGLAVNACLYPCLEVAGKEVTTVEGLATGAGQLSVIQRAFVDQGGVQCGYCTPGMVLSAKALLDENPSPDERQIREALVGNLCRCTGYTQIVAAVRAAAADLEVDHG